MALIHKVVEFFSCFTVLPVDPDEVADHVRSYGIQDEIEFVGVDIDIRVIRGALHHYSYHPSAYAAPRLCADIYFDRSQPREWRRLIAVKEVLHLLDHSVSKTTSVADCEKLISALSSYNATSSEFDIVSVHAITDLMMLYFAIAVVFPADARDIVYGPYKEGHLSLDEIRIWADLPMEVVALVMTDEWPSISNKLAGWK